jgi:hypothetical protein
MKAFGLGETGCTVAQIPICFDGFDSRRGVGIDEIGTGIYTPTQKQYAHGMFRALQCEGHGYHLTWKNVTSYV